MNISMLSAQEKSVLLAKAVGTAPEHKQFVPEWMIEIPGMASNDKELEDIVFNLYEVDRDGNPIHMPLAWKVLQHFKNEGGNLKDTEYYEWLYFDDPADAVRFWLDKISELIVEMAKEE